MQSKRALKQDEEARKLNAFCRYLRKNPDLFEQHNLHHLMLEDQDKKGKCENIEIEKIEKLEEAPVEIVVEASSEPEPEKKSEPKKKEKKPRKAKKPKEKIPDLESGVEAVLEIEKIPELKREQACPKLEVQEEKESELNAPIIIQ